MYETLGSVIRCLDVSQLSSVRRDVVRGFVKIIVPINAMFMQNKPERRHDITVSNARNKSLTRMFERIL